MHKIYLATFNGVQKNRPKDKYYFLEIKYSKTSLAKTLIWQSLHKIILKFYGLLLSQLPFSSSFESLFHQTNIWDSAVIGARPSVTQNIPKWLQSIQGVRNMYNLKTLEKQSVSLDLDVPKKLFIYVKALESCYPNVHYLQICEW